MQSHLIDDDRNKRHRVLEWLYFFSACVCFPAEQMIWTVCKALGSLRVRRDWWSCEDEGQQERRGKSVSLLTWAWKTAPERAKLSCAWKHGIRLHRKELVEKWQGEKQPDKKGLEIKIWREGYDKEDFRVSRICSMLSASWAFIHWMVS